jgi:hypothetical protein
MRSSTKKPRTATKSAKKMAKRSTPAKAAVTGLPGRAKRFVRNNPLRVLAGAAAIAVGLAKLKQRFA